MTGDSPIVIQRTTQQRVFDQQVIEQIPVGRSHINMVVLIPGLAAAQPGRGALADVGGRTICRTPRSRFMAAHTQRHASATRWCEAWQRLSGGEFSNFVPDTGSTQEVTVDYAAVSAEQPFGGLRIDIIPREGGNSVRGVVFATAVNSAWQTSNLTDELRNRGLPEPNEMKQAWDINPSVGGPLMRDKLWFYTSARWQTNQNYIAGLYYNKNEGDPTKWLCEQDQPPRFFSLEQNGVNVRLTSQLAQKHKVSFVRQPIAHLGRHARGVSPESAVAYRFPVLNLAQAAWTAPMTNKLLLEARYARRGGLLATSCPKSATCIGT